MFKDSAQQPKNSGLKLIECLGDAHQTSPRIVDTIRHSKFFEDFSDASIETLLSFMQAYRAQSGQAVIREGDVDDYMLLIIEGSVSIVKTDSQGERRPMSVVGAGSTLGEMSMIDGEPRFASCMALDTTTFAVLSRDDMAQIILEKPSLGAKVLVKLVTMLSQRLRTTSSTLIDYMERTDLV